MDKEKGIIIVPWDFTDVSKNAMKHAVQITKTFPNRIELLHIQNDEINASDTNGKAQKLSGLAKKYEEKYSVNISATTIKGNIFSSISDYAEQKDASLVIMGTHGIKGMQRVTGSKAFKVMLGSKIPFLIVKDKPKTAEKLNNILIPIDDSAENIEKLDSAVYFAKQFALKIHIITPSDVNNVQHKQMHININVANKLLSQNNIDFEIHTIKKSKRFAKETIKYAQKLKTDLILIITKHHKLKDYLNREHEQYIIDNSAKIPVLCINPMKEI
jgi:nucleotide-binding universal stress UspA family protein